MGSSSARKRPSLLETEFQDAERYASRLYFRRLPTEANSIVMIEFVRRDFKTKGLIGTVLCVCQEGKDRFLKERALAIANLVQLGVSVCILEFGGTGNTRPAEGEISPVRSLGCNFSGFG
jgi:hypothetical protein